MTDLIDFRSDVLTQMPERALAGFLAAARSSSDYTPQGNRHELHLIETLTGLFGFEGGLLLPTGTMANQVALRVWCGQGGTVLADAAAHVATNELASTIGLNDASVAPVPGRDGHFDAVALAEAVARTDSTTRRLVWLENTHNRAGGTVAPPGLSRNIGAAARAAGLPVHIDGARLWNALVFYRDTGADFGNVTESLEVSAVAGADSLTLNLNKALGGPFGAVLLGSRDFVAKAASVRKTLGGQAWRVGPFAAAALAAMDGYDARIREDHRRARMFSAALMASVPSNWRVDTPQTNIVRLNLPDQATASALAATLNAARILVPPAQDGRLRFAFHSRITDDAVKTTAAAIASAATSA
jgi:threonine aldolase